MGPKKPPKANPWIAFRQDKVLGEEIVYEFEGEKCALIGAHDGLAAISQPGFAHGVDQVAERYRCLKEAGTMLVVTVADHDEEGPKRAQQSAEAARQVELDHLILHANDIWPGMPVGGSIEKKVTSASRHFWQRWRRPRPLESSLALTPHQNRKKERTRRITPSGRCALPQI